MPISYNGGVNFYIGNNANAAQTLALRPGWEWEELVALPLREGITRPSAKSLFFYKQALEYIQDAPFDYMGLLTVKTAQFWRGDEIERNQEMYYWRKYSSVLAGTLWKWGVAFPFGLVSPLALLGLLVYIRRQGFALPVLFVLGYSFAVISFFVAARYRLPIVPLLILFAAYGGKLAICEMAATTLAPSAFADGCSRSLGAVGELGTAADGWAGQGCYTQRFGQRLFATRPVRFGAAEIRTGYAARFDVLAGLV